MKARWMHYVLFVCSVGSAVCEALAHEAVFGPGLPWHMTAAACLTIATILGAVSKSVLDTTHTTRTQEDTPEVTKALEIADEVAQSPEAAKILTEVKQ